jgi:glycine betaine/choline ABC-type transport system substrate-binding protein
LFLSAALAALGLVGAGCGGSKKPVVVGSKSNTEQMVLGEIVAQHLENRLGRPVIRSLGLGNTQLVYQSLVNGEIGLYPEDTGTIQTQIMKEAASPDPSIMLNRVRGEMRRIAQLELLDPLGLDNGWVMVVQRSEKYDTLSAAAGNKAGWKIGVTRDFNDRTDGSAILTQYRLPMSAMIRVGTPASLYPDLESGKLTLVAGNATDWQLAANDQWKVLRDDKKLFAFYQTCLLARADLLASDPKIKPALSELSGKFTNEEIQKLDREVEVQHKKPADVAAEFLTGAGLK